MSTAQVLTLAGLALGLLLSVIGFFARKLFEELKGFGSDLSELVGESRSTKQEQASHARSIAKMEVQLEASAKDRAEMRTELALLRDRCIRLEEEQKVARDRHHTFINRDFGQAIKEAVATASRDRAEPRR